MVLSCDLTGADGSGVAHHTIGWNGKALLGHPQNIIIGEEDMSDKEHARMVFNKLYPKETFHSWRIVQAFDIES